MSDRSLFREEVLDARRNDWLGTILVASPLSRWLWTALALSLALAILLFLFLGHYARRESVSGQLVPTSGLLSLTAINAGTVTDVRVHDGQSVHQGDVLVEISSEQDSAVLGDSRALVSQQLHDQRDTLQVDLSTQKLVSTQKKNTLRDKVASLHNQILQMDAQLTVQKQQVESNQLILSRIQPLIPKGYISTLQAEQIRQNLLQAQAQYETLLRQELDLRQQAGAAEQQLAQNPLDAQSQRNDTTRKLAEINQSLAQNEMQRAVVLRAPHDGVVSSVLFKPGQMVNAGQSVVTLLPAGSVLQAQLLVPSRAVGFIAPDSQVVLRYQAFPYQKFGQHFGHVAEISRSALTDAEVTALTGHGTQTTEGPLYRVQVVLDDQVVLAYGKTEMLRPGMALDADIMMERRSLFEWIFEPLFGIAHHLVSGAAHG
jgi:membrane fusion protein